MILRELAYSANKMCPHLFTKFAIIFVMRILSSMLFVCYIFLMVTLPKYFHNLSAGSSIRDSGQNIIYHQ